MTYRGEPCPTCGHRQKGKAGRPELPVERQALIRRLYAEGYTLGSIAEAMKIDVDTVRKYAKETKP